MVQAACAGCAERAAGETEEDEGRVEDVAACRYEGGWDAVERALEIASEEVDRAWGPRARRSEEPVGGGPREDEQGGGGFNDAIWQPSSSPSPVRPLRIRRHASRGEGAREPSSASPDSTEYYPSSSCRCSPSPRVRSLPTAAGTAGRAQDDALDEQYLAEYRKWQRPSSPSPSPVPPRGAKEKKKRGSRRRPRPTSASTTPCSRTRHRGERLPPARVP